MATSDETRITIPLANGETLELTESAARALQADLNRLLGTAPWPIIIERQSTPTWPQPPIITCNDHTECHS